MFRELVGPEQQKIPEVDTSSGFPALMLAELGHRGTGIDLSESMLAQAIQKAEQVGLEIEFRPGNAEQLPEEWTGVFDLVMNRHLLVDPDGPLQSPCPMEPGSKARW